MWRFTYRQHLETSFIHFTDFQLILADYMQKNGYSSVLTGNLQAGPAKSYWLKRYLYFQTYKSITYQSCMHYQCINDFFVSSR